jgi:hypothetical protein
MAVESHQLFEAAKEALGAKYAAEVMGISAAHYYVLCTDPMARSTMVRDDVMRITQLVDAMASRPHAKPKIVMWRLFFDDLFVRAIERDEATPLTCQDTLAHAERLTSEFCDVLKECRQGFNADRITKEGADLIAAVTNLIRCAEMSDNPKRPKSSPLRAG